MCALESMAHQIHVNMVFMPDLCKESNMAACFEEKCINVDFGELSVEDLWQNEGKNYFG